MIRAHLVSETHWDREWYLTKEEFGVKLARLMDGLLDTIDSVPGFVSFMMDGQTIALEDYLCIRPDNRERLRKAVASGKIVIGPWYILPDELLVSGESHIRNYLAGDRLVSQFGRKNNIGYLPDSFGHPEQMPQILKGLGIDSILFWRGTGKEIGKTEFWWEAPYAAAKVLAVHMPYGYGNSARLSADMAETVPRLNAMIDSLHRRSTSDVVLLMNGSDHVLPQQDIVEILHAYAQAAPSDREILFSTMEHFLGELKKGGQRLANYQGELRSGDRDMVLGGTLSTRVYLKQRNLRVQRTMERCLEPLAAAELLSLPQGQRRNGDFLDYQNLVWKKILENHPHDSICGCSVDAVHAEMLQRYDCIDQLQATLRGDIFYGLERSLVPGPEPAKGLCDAQMLYFEGSQDCLPHYQEFEVDFDATLVNKVNFARSMIEDYEPGLAHPDLPQAVAAVDQYGRDIPCTLISSTKAYHMDLQDQTLPEVYKVNRCRVGVLLPGFDYGLHVLRLGRSTAAPGLPDRPDRVRIENEFFVVEYCASDAGFTVEEKATGRRHSAVGRISDLADAGDEYTHSWIGNDRPYRLDPSGMTCRGSGRHGLYEELTVDGSLFLPEGLDEDRKSRSQRLVDCPLRIAVRLYPGIGRIDYSLEINNNAKDHRLQVEFPSGLLAGSCSGSTAFAVTSRPVTLIVPDTWVEYPQNCHPTHGFVHAGTAEHGISIASDSTNEYESLDQEGQTWIRLTLLRCVGWLSRADLFTRKGNGGWNLPTPGAQCLGPQRFEYGVIYHRGGFLEAGTFAEVDRKQHQVQPCQLRKTGRAVEVAVNPLAFVTSLPDCVRLSALKLRERGGGLVLRIYSIARETRRFALQLPEAVVSANSVTLDERFIEARQLRGQVLEVEIAAGEIQSYELLV